MNCYGNEAHRSAGTPSRGVVTWVIALLVFVAAGSARAEIAEPVVNRLQGAIAMVESGDTQGTAFLVGADGLMFTAAHVVQHPFEIVVTFVDGREYQASLLGYSKDGHDIAALRIQLADDDARSYLNLAPPEAMRVGRKVFVAGHPVAAFPVTFSGGMIANHSARLRSLVIDAAVASGASGSPVCTTDGDVLGLVFFNLFDSNDDGDWPVTFASGFGQAVDVTVLHQFLEEVKEGELTMVPEPVVNFLSLPLPVLDVPAEIHGTLTNQNDQLPDRSFCQGYRIDVREGSVLTIELLSDEFDAYLALIDSNGDWVAENDDADPGTTNSRIVYTAPHAGRWIVLANTYGRRETGAYLLKINTMQFGAPDVLVRELTDQHPTGRRDAHYFDHEIEGRAGQTVSIQMSSVEVDSYLYLLDDNENQIDSNDDAGPDTFDSQIIHTFTRDGVYVIRCSTFGSGETGSFRLSIAWAEEAGDKAEAEEE